MPFVLTIYGGKIKIVAYFGPLYCGRYGLCPVFFLYTGVRCSTLPLIVLLRDRLIPIVARYCAGGFFLHVRLVLSLGGYAGVGLVLRITYNEMQGRGV